MVRLFLLLILVVGAMSVHAQGLSWSTLKKSFANKKDLVFVIDGVSYAQNDSSKLDAVLQKYRENDILSMSIIKDDAIIRDPMNTVVIISFVHQLSRKEIKGKLNKLKKMFVDTYYGFSQEVSTNPKNPVLLINNKVVYITMATKKVQELKIDDVLYIELNEQPQDASMYGACAKNGIVKIWTK